MKKRVVHYCNQLSLGGTEKTMEIFCRYLDRNKFDVFAVTRLPNRGFAELFRVYFGLLIRHPKAIAKKKLWDSQYPRLPLFQKILGERNVFVAQNENDLARILSELHPDVLHIHYSGRAEAPLTLTSVVEKIPVIVTTNQFEIENTSPSHKFVKRMYFVSRWLLENKAHWAKGDARAHIMYNPCEKPQTSRNLRSDLGIPADAFVIGRVGRADPGIHDPISLNAYAKIHSDKTWFLALNAPYNMIEQAKALGCKNFVALPGTSSEEYLSAFYNTIDVLAHARKDGETFGCNIAEAMIHGKPVVSHISSEMNAQIETVDKAGVVVGLNDVDAYAAALARLRDDHSYYNQCSEAARTRAASAYEGEAITQKLSHSYQELLQNT